MNIEIAFASMVAMSRASGPGVPPRGDGFQMAWDQSGAGDRPADAPALQAEEAPEDPMPDAPLQSAPPAQAPSPGHMLAAVPDAMIAPSAAAEPPPEGPPLAVGAMAARPDQSMATTALALPAPQLPPLQAAPVPGDEMPASQRPVTTRRPEAIRWPSTFAPLAQGQSPAPAAQQAMGAAKIITTDGPLAPVPDVSPAAGQARGIPPGAGDTPRFRPSEGALIRPPLAMTTKAPAAERVQDAPSDQLTRPALPPLMSARPIAWASLAQPLVQPETSPAGPTMPLTAAPNSGPAQVELTQGRPAPIPSPSAPGMRADPLQGPATKPPADPAAAPLPDSKPGEPLDRRHVIESADPAAPLSRSGDVTGRIGHHPGPVMGAQAAPSGQPIAAPWGTSHASRQVQDMAPQQAPDAAQRPTAPFLPATAETALPDRGPEALALASRSPAASPVRPDVAAWGGGPAPFAGQAGATAPSAPQLIVPSPAAPATHPVPDATPARAHAAMDAQPTVRALAPLQTGQPEPPFTPLWDPPGASGDHALISAPLHRIDAAPGSPAAPAPPPAAPPPPAAQLSEAIVTSGDGQIDLRLDPEELGRVRVTLHQDGDVMRVHIHADRPDTLDLLRRNAGDLAAELRAAGYEGTSFSFGDQSRDQSRRQPQAGASDTASPTAHRTAPLQGSGAALDLRL